MHHHHHHMHRGYRGFGYPVFRGFGMGMGGGLLGDLLSGGVGYFIGRQSAQQQNQPYAMPYQQYPQPSANAAAGNTLEQLRLLGQLREAGTLTEEEFQVQKQRILSGL